MFNKDKDAIIYTYNMSFICSVWLICFNTSSYDIYQSQSYSPLTTRYKLVMGDRINKLAARKREENMKNPLSNL